MKKFISILLCICLLVAPFSVYAEDSQADLNTFEQTQAITENLTEEQITLEPIVEPEDEEWRRLALEKIKRKHGDTASTMAQASGLVSGGIYNIRNMDSGKYLNVHYGVDANGTNVYQWSYDGSTEQKFKVVYSSSTDSYKIYAMCSSSGTNRVIDVARNGSPLASGQNVAIWTPVDNTAQQLQIEYLNHNYYVMRMKANTSMFIAVNGTANGTGSGTSSTSAGNVYIDTYDVYRSQEWAFELISQPTTVNPTGELEAVSEIGVSGWAWRSDIPNTSITVYIYITNNSTGAEYVYTTPANRYRSDLASSYANHGFYLALDWDDFPVGTYTVNAYGESTTGSLVLLSGGPRTYTVGGPINMGALTLNTSRSATLTAGSEHIYTFTPSVAGTYVVQTRGSTDTYGTISVTQNNATQTWYDDDDGKDYNFNLLFYAPAGNTVQIKARHFDSSSGTGTYSIKVHRAHAQIFTFDYPLMDINTRGDATVPLDVFDILGYTTNNIYNATSEYASYNNPNGFLNFNSEIVFFSGHGTIPQNETRTALCFYPRNISENYSELLSTGMPLDMSGVKLAVWSACESATMVNEEPGNLSVAKIAHDRGVKISIGWADSIDKEHSYNWNKAFFTAIGRGSDVENSINYANSEFSYPYDTSVVQALRWFGDIQFCPKPVSYLESTQDYPDNFITEEEMDAEMLGYEYIIAERPLGAKRYIKIINGLPSTDYIDVWADGTIYRSRDKITLEDLKILEETIVANKIDSICEINNSDYYCLVNGELTLVRCTIEENKEIHINLFDNSIIPINALY